MSELPGLPSIVARAAPSAPGPLSVAPRAIAGATVLSGRQAGVGSLALALPLGSRADATAAHAAGAGERPLPHLVRIREVRVGPGGEMVVVLDCPGSTTMADLMTAAPLRQAMHAVASWR